MKITRRRCLQYSSSLFMAGLGWQVTEPMRGLGATERSQLDALCPINRGRDDGDLTVTGDEPHQAHTVLWPTKGGVNQLPKPDPAQLERVKVVVVGGGCAGLSAMWRLRDLKPVLLERASRMGGNARGETWRGLPYSIGAAYLVKPNDGSEIDKFLTEIGAKEGLKVSHHEPLFMLKGKQEREGFTQLLKSVSAEERASWGRLMGALRDYASEANGRLFPELPTDHPPLREMVNQMDREPFSALCERLAGGPLAPWMRAYLEQYCWTAFGAGWSEVSAASGVNFLACELDEHLIGPGGNSWITEQATRKLASSVGLDRLRPNSLVYHVEVTPEGVLVSYVDSSGATRRILAERAVLCCPKFVVKRILKGIEPERLEAISKLKYRAYTVHQALLNVPLKDDFYELFLMGDLSDAPTQDRRQRALNTGVTDLTYGNYAETSDKHTILSLYQAFPFDSGRAELYQDLSLAGHRARVMGRLRAEILPALGVSPSSLLGLRSSRWGHPLPLASPTLIAQGVIDQLRAPHKGRVFFAQQDNWALPAIEVSLYEGMKAARDVRGSLKR